MVIYSHNFPVQARESRELVMVDSSSNAASVSDLFQLLRDGRPRTRAELAKMTGLARSTIASRVDALMELGLVAAVGDAPSTGGRPSSQFAVNNAARVILAADIGASHASIAITDLAGVALVKDRLSIRIADGPEQVLKLVVDTGRGQLEQIGRSPQELIAVAIGLPGPVEFSTGRPANPPIMPGWNGFDVPAWVRNHFEVPVLVDNDVNLMALGEQGSHRGVGDLIFVKVATGIGAGIISGGALQRGARGIAGDLGHIRVARSEAVCKCGNTGCLEALASGEALAAALREQGLEAANSRDILTLIDQGNLNAVQAMRQAGRDIGEVLATCVNLINPSVIAIGGSLALAGEHLLAGIRQTVYARSTPLATEDLQITQSKARDNAALIGASIMAVQHVLAPRRIGLMASS
jgi:predicted NBD/HSP70 family sugar kinase